MFTDGSCPTLGGLVVGLLVLTVSFVPVEAQAQEGTLVDRIVAVVGDNIVLKSEVDQAVQRQTQRRNVSFSSERWMNGLQSLVDQQLLVEKARRDTTITVSDQQVTSALNRRIEQLIQRAGGEEQLEQAYGQSILEIKETFRPNMRDQLLAQKLRQRRMQNITITPSEVRQWFEQIPQDSLPRLPKTVRLSHIVRFPKPTQEARQEAKSLITSLRDSIVSGKASFEAMARQYSEHAGSASSGGAMNDVPLDQLVPAFAAVVTRIPIGEVSQVFYNDSQNGYHIVRVNSRSGNTVDFNHILIKPDSPSGERAKEYLSAVRDTLLKYEDVTFELMAKRHSEEESSAQNGGRVTPPNSDTRDLALNRLGSSWTRTIRTLEPGEISKPTQVELLNGEQAYHIILLERRIPAHRVNLESDYTRIRRYALQSKQNRKLQDYLDQLREEIYVDIRVSESDLAAMQRP